MYLRNRSSGFTLIELMIVLALVAIVALVALPSFNQLIDNNRQTTLTNSMLGLLNYGRAEALRRGAVAQITLQGAGFVVTAGGIVVRDMELISGQASITRIGTNAATPLEFRASGRTNVPARYRICGAPGINGTVINVNLGGQITTEPTTEACT